MDAIEKKINKIKKEIAESEKERAEAIAMMKMLRNQYEEEFGELPADIKPMLDSLEKDLDNLVNFINEEITRAGQELAEL